MAGTIAWSPATISARYFDPEDPEPVYHYLPDDISGSSQWLFRENVDDIPGSEVAGSSNVPSLLMIR